MKCGVILAGLKLAVQKLSFKVYRQNSFNKKFLTQMLSACSDLHPSDNYTQIIPVETQHVTPSNLKCTLSYCWQRWVEPFIYIHMQTIILPGYLVTRNSNLCEDKERSHDTSINRNFWQPSHGSVGLRARTIQVTYTVSQDVQKLLLLGAKLNLCTNHNCNLYPLPNPNVWDGQTQNQTTDTSPTPQIKHIWVCSGINRELMFPGKYF